jgi:CAAX protease family protein
MSVHRAIFGRYQTLLKRNPITTYFALTFTISWTAAFAVAASHVIHGEALPKLTGILMFPAMLLGPSFSGLVLTRLVDGGDGLQDLFYRMFRWRLSLRWYATLLIAPVLVLAVLFCLKTLVSQSYTPNRFLIGILFGVPAGFLEEIGWMGFAFPKLSSERNALAASVLLGALWSVWHLPVIDFLGTATPHGAYWFSFFFTFAAAMTAMRVLIAWIYANTRSVLLTQLMHVSSTGSLVIFSPPGVTARQEVMWYGFYASVLWLTVVVVVKVYGKCLMQRGTKETPVGR